MIKKETIRQKYTYKKLKLSKKEKKIFDKLSSYFIDKKEATSALGMKMAVGKSGFLKRVLFYFKDELKIDRIFFDSILDDVFKNSSIGEAIDKTVEEKEKEMRDFMERVEMINQEAYFRELPIRFYVKIYEGLIGMPNKPKVSELVWRLKSCTKEFATCHAFGYYPS